MNKIKIVGLALFILFHGCRKEMGSVEVGGYVKDKTTGAFVKDAAVVFLEDSSSAFGPSYYRQIAVVKTDAAGRYAFLFFAKKGWYYSASAYHDNYFSFPLANTNGKESWASIEPLRKKNIVFLYLQPEAFVKVFVKNTQNIYKSEHIIVTTGGGWGEYYGEYTDTFLVGRVWGNMKKAISWTIKLDGGGNNVNYIDSIYYPAFDTTIYTINY